jgi:hypothetical protein
MVSNTNGTSLMTSQIFAQQATPMITWNNPASIIYGTALSNTQLDATASVQGLITYNPPSGTILNASQQQQLTAILTPNDNVNYTQASATALINVNKATPKITWSDPANITYGIALNNTQLDANASVSGTFVYIPSSGTVLNAGPQTLNVLFIPTDTVDYNIVSASVLINVTQMTPKITPTITWNNPTNIVYGTALNDTQLNAITSVPGTFVYIPSSGTVLSAGPQTLNVLFIPTDTVDYNIVSASVLINVTKAAPTLIWSNPANITHGTKLSSTQLDATSSVNGNFTYIPSSGKILNVGTHTLNVFFTPTDIIDYTTASASALINVTKKTLENYMK